MTLKKALFMEELISNHSRIMDRYDPQKTVALVVDEWGTWYDVEPGTNPGFLYQQNTMRDALTAAVTLNIFNRHCDRVKMANIAQMINVLQAVILTDGEKMLLTPTYHVFDLYKEHQEGTLVESYVAASNIGTENALVPDLHVSASGSNNGAIHVTLANLSSTESHKIDMEIIGSAADNVKARILTGEKNAHNDFGNANRVKCDDFTGISRTGQSIIFTIPPCSVLGINLE